ncbi:major facilitator superfamily domain-containing protein [Aspergillus karnatakaensis]|uniref:MFS transporter n=1 Tax=Aspergillus karnatakaensis TaxID=1810916 RepID=UPI003CCCBE36
MLRNDLIDDEVHGVDGEHDDSSTLTGSDEDLEVKRPRSFTGEVAFVTVVCMAQLVSQAGLGQVISILPILGESFGIGNNMSRLSWFPAAYSLTVGTFILGAGRLGDLYGHKLLFIAGFFWLAIWTLIAGFAEFTGPVFFCFCRVLQGIGPALLLPNGMAILARSYEPGPRKGMVFSAFGSTAPSGFIFGGLVSAVAAKYQSWPWGFWFMAILETLCGIAAIYLIPRTPTPPTKTTHSLWARMDFAGCVTGICGLLIFNIALNLAPGAQWQDPSIYILFVASFVFFGLFGYIERKAAFPLIPFAAITPDIGFVLATLACGWAAFGVWVFYGWEFVQNFRGISPLFACLQFSPAAISGLVCAFTTGLILQKLPANVVMMISAAAFCIADILYATMPIKQTYWAQLFVSVLVMPWGMEMSFPASNILLSNAMPQEHQGVSASLVATIMNYAISLGLGFGAIVETHLNKNGSDLLRGYRGAWYLGVGLSGSGIILTLFFALHEHRKSVRTKKVGALGPE